LLLAAYGGLGVVFARLWADAAVPQAVVLVLIAFAAGIALVPSFLGGTRTLEIASARSLLDVELLTRCRTGGSTRRPGCVPPCG